MSYADGNDLMLRYDVDWIGDCATDDRETQQWESIKTHPAVLTALEGASGEVEAALMAGGNYDLEQLAALEGTSLALLKDLVCGLAMPRLWSRRAEAIPDNEDQKMARWLDLLDRLKKGQNIFNLPEKIDASLVDIDGPTPVELTHRNDLTTRSRQFPLPVTRLPTSQGGGHGERRDRNTY